MVILGTVFVLGTGSPWVQGHHRYRVIVCTGSSWVQVHHWYRVIVSTGSSKIQRMVFIRLS